MTNIDYTHTDVLSAIDRAEQLSLVLLMLLEQDIPPQDLRGHLTPLLSKLNGDLQTASLMSRLCSEVVPTGCSIALSAP